LASFISITVIIYLVTYIYCLFNNTEVLRSEKYSTQRLVGEKGDSYELPDKSHTNPISALDASLNNQTIRN
jgi:hypothetical protein